MSTRLDIQTAIQQNFANPNYYTTVDMNDSIQDGYDEIVAFTGCNYKSAVIPFTPQLSYYDLLTLLGDYIGLVAMFNVVIQRWMIPTSTRKLDQFRWDWETSNGTPEYFVPINHRYVAIFKKPSATYGNMIVFYRAAAPTLDDSTVIAIPEVHQTTLENYCITDLWEQNQEWNKAGREMQAYVDNLEQFRALIQSQRNPDRPPNLK